MTIKRIFKRGNLKKLLIVLVIMTCLIILPGCSSREANFTIEYTGYDSQVGECLKWVLVEMVFYYGPNSEGVIVCIYSQDKDAKDGLIYKVVGKVLNVYFEGVLNPNTGKVKNGQKLEYFDHRDEILLYYP